MAMSEKNFDWFWEKLEGYLKQQDLKNTKQRRVIIEEFLKLESHIDAEQLHARIREVHPGIGLATIYRTLSLLKEAGLIEEQSFVEGKAVFEVDTPGSHHDHLVCTKCGKVVEFHNEEIEDLQAQVAKEFGFSLLDHRLTLYGRCFKTCNS
jgi:Fur family transcriptional regulator, ferric uptake regulator